MTSHIPAVELVGLAMHHGTPLYVYHKGSIAQRIALLKSTQFPYGGTIRYAVKANPHRDIIQYIASQGIHFDASSSYEASLLLEQNIPGGRISLSSQQPAHNLDYLLDAGVHYIATSLHQLELFAHSASAGAQVGLRINPGSGSGHNNRTTTGGTNSSFGLWHEYLDDALRLANRHALSIVTLHIHIGSGADPSAWAQVIDIALAIAARIPDITTLNIGGGYKIRRAPGEKETDMSHVLKIFAEHMRLFAQTSGRQLHLEIEPGTWLVGHAGTLLTSVVDSVDTGENGHRFLRTDTGMNDFMRPTLYGAQHHIEALNNSPDYEEYVIAGHNCETGDILTPAPGNPEQLHPRRLRKTAIGDILAIHDVGAYGATLGASGYNAFPPAKELFI